MLLSHPRLPLVAAVDHSAVRIWDYSGGKSRELGSVLSRPAGWHPVEPELLVVDDGTVRRWTPAGVSAIDGVPRCQEAAFSPDGRALWLSDWSSSVSFDVATGTTVAGPGWDTGVVAHPAGGLVATLSSDQDCTLVLFSPDAGPGLRPVRRALILGVDGYEAPIFSSDGRYFAVRGNSYESTLEVFAFPSLRRVLGLVFDGPEEWSHHNVVFGESLVIGTPAGSLIEVTIPGGSTTEYDVLPGSSVTALATLASGELVLAGRNGELVVTGEQRVAQEAAEAVVAEFLASTSEAEVVDRDELDLADGTGDTSWRRIRGRSGGNAGPRRRPAQARRPPRPIR